MMTEHAQHTQTLMERDTRSPFESDPSTDIDDDGETIIRGDNRFSDPQPTTEDVVVRGENLSDETYNARLEKGLANELKYFYIFLDLKVKNELAVQVYKDANEGEINITRVATLLQTLFEKEKNDRLEAANLIQFNHLPGAEQRQTPTGVADEYSKQDIDMLNLRFEMQLMAVDQIEAMEPKNYAGYHELAESYVERLLAGVQEEVTVLQLEQEIVEHLTREAQQLAA